MNLLVKSGRCRKVPLLMSRATPTSRVDANGAGPEGGGQVVSRHGYLPEEVMVAAAMRSHVRGEQSFTAGTMVREGGGGFRTEKGEKVP